MNVCWFDGIDWRWFGNRFLALYFHLVLWLLHNHQDCKSRACQIYQGQKLFDYMTLKLFAFTSQLCNVLLISSTFFYWYDNKENIKRITLLLIRLKRENCLLTLRKWMKILPPPFHYHFSIKCTPKLPP